MKLFNWNIEINYVGGYGFIFSFTHTYFTWLEAGEKVKKFSDPLVYQTVWFCLRFHRILSMLLLLTRPYRAYSIGRIVIFNPRLFVTVFGPGSRDILAQDEWLGHQNHRNNISTFLALLVALDSTPLCHSLGQSAGR